MTITIRDDYQDTSRTLLCFGTVAGGTVNVGNPEGLRA